MGSSSEPTPDKAKSRASRIMVWVICLLIVGAGLFQLQQILVPKADQSLGPVVIESGERKKEGDADAVVDQGVVLPPNCITAEISQQTIDEAEHPLDPLIKVARAGLVGIDQSIEDYSSLMISQVFVDGVLHEEKYMFCKIRHAREDDENPVPFSVFLKYLKPQSIVGQEAIWVRGQNDDKIIGHATGLLNMKRLSLNPTGSLAMAGNRFPIYEIGFKNLLRKMISFAEDDRKHGECEVTLTRNIQVDGRTCTKIEAVHPVKRPHFEYHIARIFIDDERNIPVAFEGYLWPENPGEDPPLLEKYYYTDIKLNQNFTDEDFDPSNSEYDFPSW